MQPYEWTEFPNQCKTLSAAHHLKKFCLCPKQHGESGKGSNSHCDWEDVAGRRDGHARAEHHLLTMSVQHAVVRAPG